MTENITFTYVAYCDEGPLIKGLSQNPLFESVGPGLFRFGIRDISFGWFTIKNDPTPGQHIKHCLIKFETDFATFELVLKKLYLPVHLNLLNLDFIVKGIDGFLCPSHMEWENHLLEGGKKGKRSSVPTKIRSKILIEKETKYKDVEVEAWLQVTTFKDIGLDQATLDKIYGTHKYKTKMKEDYTIEKCCSETTYGRWVKRYLKA